MSSVLKRRGDFRFPREPYLNRLGLVLPLGVINLLLLLLVADEMLSGSNETTDEPVAKINVEVEHFGNAGRVEWRIVRELGLGDLGAVAACAGVFVRVGRTLITAITAITAMLTCEIDYRSRSMHSDCPGVQEG